MNVKHLITAAVAAILPLTLSAATLVIPAAGTGAGSNGSRWQTELTLHSTSSSIVIVSASFHDASGQVAQTAITLAPRSTVSLQDVVKNKFGVETATGAIVLNIPDSDASRIAVRSRTINVSANGTYGQDIPAMRTTEALGTGDMAVLAAPSVAFDDRFNVGIYALTNTSVKWQLVRADGTVAARAETTQAAGTQKQYNNGVSTLFGSAPANNDVIYASIASGQAFFYGSAVNQASGDPSFVPAIKLREDIRINFLGVDRNEDGVAEYVDANRDGMIDTTMDLVTSMYPAYFRVLVSGANGEAATLSLVDSPADWILIGKDGIQIAPTGELKGKTATLKVRATIGTESVILSIPVRFV